MTVTRIQPADADVNIRLSAKEASRLLRLLTFARRSIDMLRHLDAISCAQADLYVTQLRIQLQNAGVTE